MSAGRSREGCKTQVFGLVSNQAILEVTASGRGPISPSLQGAPRDKLDTKSIREVGKTLLVLVATILRLFSSGSGVDFSTFSPASQLNTAASVAWAGKRTLLTKERLGQARWPRWLPTTLLPTRPS